MCAAVLDHILTMAKASAATAATTATTASSSATASLPSRSLQPGPAGKQHHGQDEGDDDDDDDSQTPSLFNQLQQVIFDQCMYSCPFSLHSLHWSLPFPHLFSRTFLGSHDCLSLLSDLPGILTLYSSFSEASSTPEH